MKHFLVVVGVVGLAVAGWRWHADKTAVASKEGEIRATDRIWIDHLPKHDRDLINVFVAFSRTYEGEETIGAFQTASRWQHSAELFKYQDKGGELLALFPQTGSKESFKITARTCNDQGMDFCLELSGGKHGVKRYYSMKGWEIDRDGSDGLAAEQHLLDTLAHE